MSVETSTDANAAGGGARGMASIIRFLERLPGDIVAIPARIVMALIFWRSGQTKVDGFSINEDTFDLFVEEYKVPVLPPELAAYMATALELMCPVLLVIGLATRFSALALLGMTLVIQTFVYSDAYITHGLWAVALLYLILRGPGVLSLDHFIRKKYMG